MKLFDKANDALKLIQDSLNTLLARRNELVQLISHTNTDIKSLLDMPMSIDDFCSFIPHFVKDEGNRAYGSSLRVNLHEAEYNKPKNKKRWGDLETEEGEVNGCYLISGSSGISCDDSGVAAFRMMCFFMPEKVIEKLTEKMISELGEKWGNTDLPSISERRQQVAKLREERTTLEKELNEVNGEISRINGIVESIPKPPEVHESPETGTFTADNGMKTTISKDAHGNKFSTII